MYAIVDIAGQQFKVEKNQKVFVHRIDAKEGSSVDFDKVLLVDNDGKVQVGAPTVANTFVSAKVVSHLKGDKVKVFKKKRRKGYQLLNGHRQYMTELLIEDIKEGKAAKKAEAKKEEAPKDAAQPKAKATAEKGEEKAAPQKKAAPKAAAKPKAETKAKAEKKDTKEDKAE